MKSMPFAFLWVCCLVLLGACKDDDDGPAPVKVSRTVLIYLAADNSLTTNGDFATIDLQEMKEGIVKLNVSGMHLLVYIDTGNSPRLIELQNKNGKAVENVVKTYEKRNSVGVSETIEVFNEVFSKKEYQADSYGLIYWSHGEGWIPNPLPKTRWIGQDVSNGTNYMNIADFVTILKSAPHFDFILCDACFMQSVEVAYATRNYTDYYIGSPTEIPGPGARYDILIPAMFSEGDVSLKTAKAYYEPYAEIYNGGKNMSNENWTGGVSIALLKSSELESLASTTKQLLLMNASSTELRSRVFNYDKRSPSDTFYVGYYDMVEMMRLLTDEAGFISWKQAFDATVVYWATTDMNYSAYADMFSMQGTSGISHYIPSSSNSAANIAYRSTEWYEAAGLSKLGW